MTVCIISWRNTFHHHLCLPPQPPSPPHARRHGATNPRRHPRPAPPDPSCPPARTTQLIPVFVAVFPADGAASHPPPNAQRLTPNAHLPPPTAHLPTTPAHRPPPTAHRHHRRAVADRARPVVCDGAQRDHVSSAATGPTSDPSGNPASFERQSDELPVAVTETRRLPRAAPGDRVLVLGEGVAGRGSSEKIQPPAANRICRGTDRWIVQPFSDHESNKVGCISRTTADKSFIWERMTADAGMKFGRPHLEK